jgi:Ran GTPase-activating protein (RanGAP) involved in mRNA processing and transport
MFQTLLANIRDNQLTDECLTLTNQELNSEDMVQLAAAIESNPYIKSLDLSYNAIDDDGAEVLSKISQLTEINLTANQIGPKGAEHLAKSELKKINLTANLIGDEGAAYFVGNLRLDTLSLSECGLTEVGVNSIVKNINLKSLSLSNNNISPEETIVFPEDSQLESLDLSQNTLYDETVFEITKLKKLKLLNLHSNNIDDDGALALSQMTSLKTLILGQNYITKIGAMYIFNTRSIEMLNLFNNRLEFLEADDFPENHTLVEINLTHNFLNDRCEAVLKQLASITTLEKLDLSSNEIGEKGAEILMKYKTPMLNSICLMDNPVFNKRKAQDAIENFSDGDGQLKKNTKNSRISTVQ